MIIIPDHYIFTSDPRANRNVDILRCVRLQCSGTCQQHPGWLSDTDPTVCVHVLAATAGLHALKSKGAHLQLCCASS